MTKVDDDAEVFVSTCDPRGAFYRFNIDFELSRSSGLPPLRAGGRGIRELEGERLTGDRQVRTCFAVPPVGFNWPLYLAQEAVAIQVEAAAGALGGRKAGAQLSKGQACEALDHVGLETHEQVGARSEAAVLGVSIDGKSGIASTALSRARQVDGLLPRLTKRGVATGHGLESVVRRLAFLSAPRRPLLAVLSAARQVLGDVGLGQLGLWPLLRAELEAARSPLPSAYATGKLPWHCDVATTGARPAGWGVVKSPRAAEKVEGAGRVDERLGCRMQRQAGEVWEEGPEFPDVGPNWIHEGPWKYIYSGGDARGMGSRRALAAAPPGRRTERRLAANGQSAPTKAARRDRYSVEADATPGRSFVETKAVGEKMGAQCSKVVQVFDERFFDGQDRGAGRRLLAALEGICPKFGKNGQLRVAVGALKSLVTHERPDEIHQDLEAKRPIPPMSDIGPRRAIAIRPSQALCPAKVGICDDVVASGQEEPWAGDLLRWLVHGKGVVGPTVPGTSLCAGHLARRGCPAASGAAAAGGAVAQAAARGGGDGAQGQTAMAQQSAALSLETSPASATVQPALVPSPPRLEPLPSKAPLLRGWVERATSRAVDSIQLVAGASVDAQSLPSRLSTDLLELRAILIKMGCNPDARDSRGVLGPARPYLDKLSATAAQCEAGLPQVLTERRRFRPDRPPMFMELGKEALAAVQDVARASRVEIHAQRSDVLRAGDPAARPPAGTCVWGTKAEKGNETLWGDPSGMSAALWAPADNGSPTLIDVASLSQLPGFKVVAFDLLADGLPRFLPLCPLPLLSGAFPRARRVGFLSSEETPRISFCVIFPGRLAHFDIATALSELRCAHPPGPAFFGLGGLAAVSNAFFFECNLPGVARRRWPSCSHVFVLSPTRFPLAPGDFWAAARGEVWLLGAANAATRLKRRPSGFGGRVIAAPAAVAQRADAAERRAGKSHSISDYLAEIWAQGEMCLQDSEVLNRLMQHAISSTGLQLPLAPDPGDLEAGGRAPVGRGQLPAAGGAIKVMVKNKADAFTPRATLRNKAIQVGNDLIDIKVGNDSLELGIAPGNAVGSLQPSLYSGTLCVFFNRSVFCYASTVPSFFAASCPRLACPPSSSPAAYSPPTTLSQHRRLTTPLSTSQFTFAAASGYSAPLEPADRPLPPPQAHFPAPAALSADRRGQCAGDFSSATWSARALATDIHRRDAKSSCIHELMLKSDICLITGAHGFETSNSTWGARDQSEFAAALGDRFGLAEMRQALVYAPFNSLAIAPSTSWADSASSSSGGDFRATHARRRSARLAYRLAPVRAGGISAALQPDGEVVTRPDAKAAALLPHWGEISADKVIDEALQRKWAGNDAGDRPAIDESDNSSPGLDGIPSLAQRRNAVLSTAFLLDAFPALSPADGATLMQAFAFADDFNAGALVFPPEKPSGAARGPMNWPPPDILKSLSSVVFSRDLVDISGVAGIARVRVAGRAAHRSGGLRVLPRAAALRAAVQAADSAARLGWQHDWAASSFPFSLESALLAFAARGATAQAFLDPSFEAGRREGWQARARVVAPIFCAAAMGRALRRRLDHWQLDVIPGRRARRPPQGAAAAAAAVVAASCLGGAMSREGSRWRSDSRDGRRGGVAWPERGGERARRGSGSRSREGGRREVGRSGDRRGDRHSSSARRGGRCEDDRGDGRRGDGHGASSARGEARPAPPERRRPRAFSRSREMGGPASPERPAGGGGPPRRPDGARGHPGQSPPCGRGGEAGAEARRAPRSRGRSPGSSSPRRSPPSRPDEPREQLRRPPRGAAPEARRAPRAAGRSQDSSSSRRSPPRKMARVSAFDQAVAAPEELTALQKLAVLTEENPAVALALPSVPIAGGLAAASAVAAAGTGTPALPDALAVPAAAMQAAVQQQAYPHNAELEAFLVRHPLEAHAVTRLRSMPPEQVHMVISMSLQGARNATAVICGRISNIDKFAGGVQMGARSGAKALQGPSVSYQQPTAGLSGVVSTMMPEDPPPDPTVRDEELDAVVAQITHEASRTTKRGKSSKGEASADLAKGTPALKTPFASRKIHRAPSPPKRPEEVQPEEPSQPRPVLLPPGTIQALAPVAEAPAPPAPLAEVRAAASAPAPAPGAVACGRTLEAGYVAVPERPAGAPRLEAQEDNHGKRAGEDSGAGRQVNRRHAERAAHAAPAEAPAGAAGGAARAQFEALVGAGVLVPRQRDAGQRKHAGRYIRGFGPVPLACGWASGAYLAEAVQGLVRARSGSFRACLCHPQE
ncbi:unnamed protein product [Prorocentrum cordatum]|uniref:RNA-directed RNA polymerase n=1 Tax=Prorocentrum cordatum TaxID=2364126 RepID=A0ABN9SCW7_9DINO|nr:unnamed protein product [Polarella glacialis]